MNIRIKAWIYFSLLTLLILGVFLACGEPDPAIAPSPSDDSAETTVDIKSANGTYNLPDEAVSLVEPLKPPDKIEIIYFYAPQRCPNCIYIEKRVTHVVETYFQDEVNAGRLTFKQLNLGDKENTAIANKYMAISSQLFINAITDEVDHIKNIKEVWFKEYLKDAEAFDEVIKSYIERGLNGEL